MMKNVVAVQIRLSKALGAMPNLRFDGYHK